MADITGAASVITIVTTYHAMSNSAPKPQSKSLRKRINEPTVPPPRTIVGGRESPGPDSPALEIAMTVANARSTYSQLRILNGGGIAGNREPLELSLDRSVGLLSKLRARTKGEDLLSINRALRSIRDYRRLFPRLDASNQEEAGEARRVLDEMFEL